MPSLHKRVALVGIDNSKWIIDSGADVSVINSLEGLDSSTFRPSSMVLASAGGEKTKAAKEGSIRLRFANTEGKEVLLKLQRVFYVPQMREQLLSVKDLIRDNNIRVNFDGEGVRVTTSDGARLRLAGADYKAYPASVASVRRLRRSQFKQPPPCPKSSRRKRSMSGKRFRGPSANRNRYNYN